MTVHRHPGHFAVQGETDGEMTGRLSSKRKWDKSEMESIAESTTHCSDVFCQTEPLLGERLGGLLSAGASASPSTLSFPTDVNVGWVHPQLGHERISGEWEGGRGSFSCFCHYSGIFFTSYIQKIEKTNVKPNKGGVKQPVVFHSS